MKNCFPTGGKLADLEETCQCCLKLSGSQSFFPGTSERTVIIAGEEINVISAMNVVLVRFFFH